MYVPPTLNLAYTSLNFQKKPDRIKRPGFSA